MKYTTLRLILGDQLNSEHHWFTQVDPNVIYVLAELRQETDYVKHHVQKVCAFFAAMESFAHELKEAGHQVLYLTLDDTQAYRDLPHLLESLLTQFNISQFAYQTPDEYRLLQQLREWHASGVTKTEYDSQHFMVPFDELAADFPTGKSVLMEHFYRRMRKRHQILMTSGGEPIEGQWNFDQDNRNALKKADLADIPAPLCFTNPVETILQRLTRHSVVTFGTATSTLLWPINRAQALNLLAYFCQHCLANFGRFQDAMTANSPHQWSLYHSRLSFVLNVKLLSPKEVIDAVVSYYSQHTQSVTLAQVEGFVRQILGWREYVRGMYWANMPNFREKNALDAQRKLPSYFWHGKTHMRCIGAAINQSLDYAYAHHIQRLMITGNFALLTGCSPDEVDDWYLGIYVDALEWVELPNTRGMALFADDGLIATKPYIASGSYVNKMSDYCKECPYQVKEKVGSDACPLNAWYWAFLYRHRERFSSNHRMKMMYRVWERFAPELQGQILATAEENFARIEQL